jgi:hypothetical protein
MFVTDSALDAGLDYVADNADKIVVCSQEPTTYTQAATTYFLGGVAIDSTDFTKANGDVSGRKITLAQQTGTVTNTGTASHWAVIDDTDTELVATGALSASQGLTADNPLQINAVDVLEIKDPS